MEFQKKLNDKGHDVHDLNVVMTIASPHWEKLDPKDKEEYKRTAERFNKSKFTSKFERKLELVKQIEQQKYLNMCEEINEIVVEASNAGGGLTNLMAIEIF